MVRIQAIVCALFLIITNLSLYSMEPENPSTLSLRMMSPEPPQECGICYGALTPSLVNEQANEHASVHVQAAPREWLSCTNHAGQFHIHCLRKALAINGLCPLCKAPSSFVMDDVSPLVSPAVIKTIFDALLYKNTYALHILMHENPSCVNDAHENGYTPLLFAALLKEPSLLHHLLEAGADINAHDHEGNSALMLAIAIHPTAPPEKYLQSVALLLHAKADTTHTNHAGETPLQFAAYAENSTIVKLLLENQSPNSPTSFSKYSALIHAIHDNHEALVTLLLNANVAIDEKDTDGNTALLWAAQKGNHRLIHTLLHANAYIDHQNNEGHSALSLAVQGNHAHSIYTLLRSGSTVNETYLQDMPLLCYTAYHNNAPLTKELLHYRADIDSVDLTGMTPLAHASSQGNTSTVQILLDYGASTEISTQEGNTPLLLATHNGHVQTIKILLENEAEHDHENNQQQTALMIAQAHNAVEIIDMLQVHALKTSFKHMLLYLYRRIFS